MPLAMAWEHLCCNGEFVAYASWALSKTEQKYSELEKEPLCSMATSIFTITCMEDVQASLLIIVHQRLLLSIQSTRLHLEFRNSCCSFNLMISNYNFVSYQQFLLLIPSPGCTYLILMTNCRRYCIKILHPKILMQLHAAHLGVEKIKQRARMLVCLLGLNIDIEEYVRKCKRPKNTPSNKNKPLINHIIPPLPWQKVAPDIFKWNGVDLTMTSDYHSRFFLSWQVEYLNFKCSNY